MLIYFSKIVELGRKGHKIEFRFTDSHCFCWNIFIILCYSSEPNITFSRLLVLYFSCKRKQWMHVNLSKQGVHNNFFQQDSHPKSFWHLNEIGQSVLHILEKGASELTSWVVVMVLLHWNDLLRHLAPTQTVFLDVWTMNSLALGHFW